MSGIEEKYKVDHLILLVGGNPLPNAVAGRLLVKPGGKVTLVHSAETADVAQRLANWLKQTDASFTVGYKQIEESNPTNIIQSLKSLLKDEKETIGLHYTGGTKAMAVHAHRVVRECGKEVVLSYLDARTLQLVIDANSPETGQKPDVGYVGRAVLLSIEELLQLQDLSVNKIERTASKPNLSRVLHDPTKHIIWYQWQKNEITEKCRDPQKRDKWKKAEELQKVMINWPADTDLANALKDDLEQDGETIILPKKPESLLKWLEGGYWLDEVVFQMMEELKTDCQLNDIATGIEPQFGTAGKGGNFEIDVIAMRGYQCFAISCTTDPTKKMGKGKLLEAYIRAKQLGGDEAKVALVCFSDCPQELENEIAFWDQEIRVFGKPHLSELKDHLERWINESNKEEDALCNWS